MVNLLVDGEYEWRPLSQELVDKIRKEASLMDEATPETVRIYEEEEIP